MTEPNYLDLTIRVNPQLVRLRAADGKALLKATGRTLAEITSSGDLTDIAQAHAFLALRKIERESLTPIEGVYPYRDPAVTWEMADEVEVEFVSDRPSPDPLSESSSSD